MYNCVSGKKALSINKFYCIHYKPVVLKLWHASESPGELVKNTPRGEKKTHSQRDFPGGPVVESLLANAGDIGLISGLERSHMPENN